jgi:hypothetical protein
MVLLIDDDMSSMEQPMESSSSNKDWTQSRKYHIAGFLCFIVIVIVTCVGVLASNSIQHALGVEGDDDDKGNTKSSSTTTTFDLNKTTAITTPSPTTVSPSNIPSKHPSHFPSLQPSLTDSNHPSLTPTTSLPTYSISPSVLPSMVPSISSEPSTQPPDIFGIYIMGDVVSN